MKIKKIKNWTADILVETVSHWVLNINLEISSNWLEEVLLHTQIVSYAPLWALVIVLLNVMTILNQLGWVFQLIMANSWEFDRKILFWLYITHGVFCN